MYFVRSLYKMKRIFMRRNFPLKKALFCGGGGGGEKSFTILLKKLRFLREEKGFALIGVLVASAIGLIVISGLTQLFVNMGAQIKQQESRAGLRTFKSLIERSFQDSAACKANLEQFLGDPADASKAGLWNNAKKATGAGTIDFDKVRDKDGNIIEDLSSSSLESDYGLSGHVTLQLKCESPPCDCSRHPTGWSGGKCEKDWSVSLISQRKIKGVHIFNKPELLSKVKVSFKDKDDRTDWECKGLLLPPSIGCLTLKGSGNERSLVGCGTTQTITKAGSEGTTALGYNAGSKNLTGGGSTFVGSEAGYSNTTGQNNTFLGDQAGYKTKTGQSNTFVGSEAGYKNIEGAYNTFVGRVSGWSNTTGENNTFLGDAAGFLNKTGKYNTFLGYKAGYSNKTGKYNTIIGYNAGYSNTTGGVTFIGYQAGYKSEKYGGTFVGYQAGYNTTIGASNTFVGTGAGYGNITGQYNTFVGSGAGARSTSVGNIGNTFVGYRTGEINTGSRNTFVGYRTGEDNKTGRNNTFVGSHAGQRNETGQYNTFLGASAGYGNTTGKYNTFVGMSAGSRTKTGDNNTFLGYNAGYIYSPPATPIRNIGSNNTFLGYKAGCRNTTGSNNTFVGHFAGQNNKVGKNNTFIGYNAGSGVNTHNQLRIGSNTDPDWIKGTIGGNVLWVGSGKVQIGSSSRTLKKNIKPYNHFTDRLKDIIQTPLFTYEFKAKDKHPEKNRMGIIAEELPDRLKLKTKGEPPHPDWPSIYGTFWASIKALWDMIQNTNQKVESLEKELKEVKRELENMKLKHEIQCPIMTQYQCLSMNQNSENQSK